MKDEAEDILAELEYVDYEGAMAIAYAILKLARAQESIATHLKYLGNGDAATTMGAIEAFGMHIGEKLDAIANSLRSSE